MLISEKNQKAIRDRFQDLKSQVVIQFFESSLNCQSCTEVRQLLTELAALSDLITLEVYNVYADEEKAKALGIEQAPVIVLTDESRVDYGIRFFGAPAGYEFATLLEDIIMISQGDSGLKDDTRQALSGLGQTVNLKVFVTPTCPYCPAAVRLAHQFAYESTSVTGIMVEATEFPDLANQFGVYGVPKTVINDANDYSLEGAAPETMLLERITEAVSA